MKILLHFICSLLVLSVANPVHAQGMRDHTRPANVRNNPALSAEQAAAVTLTLNSVSVRPIQVWVRTAGTMDRTGKVLTGYVYSGEADIVRTGQRVRIFSPESKSSMSQARVTKVTRQEARALIEVTLSGVGHGNSQNYVMEIVTEGGEFLSIPNEAIIEEGTKQVVYVQRQPGQYLPQEVRTGVQGERYTAIQDGLKDGDQVVTFGSFFIDSEYKLKSGDPGAGGAR